MFKFEYDPNKSQLNEQKHGINFVEAQQLWQDEDLIEIPVKRETLDCCNYLSGECYTHYFSL